MAPITVGARVFASGISLRSKASTERLSCTFARRTTMPACDLPVRAVYACTRRLTAASPA
jgi:hypothetical protein